MNRKSDSGQFEAHLKGRRCDESFSVRTTPKRHYLFPGFADPREDFMNQAMLDAPRWVGGPPICKAVNYPAFATEEGMKKFEAMYTDNSNRKVTARWSCSACGGWHYKAEKA